MPTTKPRHVITETPQVARAIDVAALKWPELRDDRAALVRKLIEVGHTAVVANTIHDRIDELAGAATGAYPPNAIADLKAEWPT